jgi:hypothetical protein
MKREKKLGFWMSQICPFPYYSRKGTRSTRSTRNPVVYGFRRGGGAEVREVRETPCFCGFRRGGGDCGPWGCCGAHVPPAALGGQGDAPEAFERSPSKGLRLGSRCNLVEPPPLPRDGEHGLRGGTRTGEPRVVPFPTVPLCVLSAARPPGPSSEKIGPGGARRGARGGMAARGQGAGGEAAHARG